MARARLFTRFLLGLAAAWVYASPCFAQLRIATWNTEDGPTSPFSSDFITIVTAMGQESVNGIAKPVDLFILQEQGITTASNLASMLNTIYGVDTYQSSLDPLTDIDGDIFDDKLGYVWNSATLSIDPSDFVAINTTGPRPAYRALWQPVGYTDPGAAFYTYSSHFKAGQNTSDENTRAQEAARLRQNGNSLGPSANIIYAGDYNIYGSFETAYQNLTTFAGDGLPIDPKNGGFNKFTHSQDPGGAMNDRFDFQLISEEMNDSEGVALIDNVFGYRSFGNDGSHNFNQPITTGIGAASNVLSALASAADHLPVVVDYQLPAVLDVLVSAIPSQVDLGVTVNVDVFIENVAQVVGVLGADELEYTLSTSGDLTGAHSGTLLALAGEVAHAIGLDTSTPGMKSGTLTVSSTSEAAENALFTLPISFEVLSSLLPGDFNGDGMVDILDLDILSSNFGTIGGATPADGDANSDSNVDILDLDILSAHFGANSASASVPEPSALLALGALLSYLARKRQEKLG